MSDFYLDRDKRGQPVENIILEFCRIQKLPAELNPAPESDYESRAAYDILIDGIPCDIKSDWMAWHTRNICVERASLEHTQSEYFIYAFPRPSSLLFHVFPVSELKTLYLAKSSVRQGDGTYAEQYLYQHKVVGDQPTNDAVLLPMEIIQTVGESWWSFVKSIKQQSSKAA